MADRSTANLVNRLFVPEERWGWEYVEPVPAVRNPHAAQQPVWYEPPAPDVRQWEQARAKAMRQVPQGIGIVVLLSVAGFLFSNLIGFSLLLLGLLAVGLPVLLPTQRIKQAKEEAARQREEQAKKFQEAYARWQASSAAHEQEQQWKQQSAELWYPLRPKSGVSRVDVFGGVPDGWASLIATLGSSLLQTGQNLMVLDFTEQGIANDLADFASYRRFPVSELDLPDELNQAKLLAGLESEELAEVLAEAVHTMRKGNEGADLRALDAELISAVLERLEALPTFTRLVAGLKVLRRVYDVSADGVLSANEVRALTAHLDIVGQSERVQQELQFLTSVLELLAKVESQNSVDGELARKTGLPASLWPASGLAVLATVTNHQRRKDFLDRLVIHRVLHELRTFRRGSGGGVLIMAGGDHLGLPTLEALARQARRSGVRLVMMLENLREELQHLLGSTDSAAIVMRLGNAKEAAAAAEFIGRGYKFILNQLTKQVGTTFTEGDSQSISDQDSLSYTTGTNWGTGKNRGQGKRSKSWSSSEGSSESTSKSRSQSWQDSINQSTAESVTEGETLSRVYEFAVEPTEIQGLPPTAYLLVEPGPAGRRIVMGDCNPGITLLNRVASRSR